MAVPTTVPIPSAATIAATSANIHDLKAALAASSLTVHDGGEMSDNDDITPSTAAVHIPWSSDSFLDTSDDQPMEPGSFEGPEKLLEIHFAPHMQDVQHIRTPLNNNNAFIGVEGEEERYGLRIIPKVVWEEMLDIVQCKVLHSIHHPTVDAYVLSESSFFVFPHKLILKTCGTTTLLMALPKILEFAQDWCGLLHSPSSSGAEMKEEEDQQQQQPYRVFYSRKKFLFPEKQVHVHREWKDEVEFLDRHFNSGSAYTIGKVNGDHWCLYVTAPFLGYPCNSNKEVKGDETAMENLPEEDDTTQGGLFGFPPTRPLSRASSSRSSSASTTDESESEDTPTTTTTQGADGEDYDQTIEILMTDLNPKAMQKFYHHANKNQPSGSEGGEVVDQQTGLATLFPEAEIDSFLFTPCGYSANALLKQSSSTGAGAGKYFTIHVTPEPVCSYASFETNIPVRLSSSSKTHHLSAKGTAPETVQELIQRVVTIFQPGNLTVTIFASAKPGASQKQIEKRQFKMLHSLRSLPGFRRTDRILYGLDGYDLIYGHYLAV